MSGALNTVAVSLMKIANDIRFLGSGPRYLCFGLPAFIGLYHCRRVFKCMTCVMMVTLNGIGWCGGRIVTKACLQQICSLHMSESHVFYTR